jgi:glyoxylase-like metal-dependent hydrolase (beta-lactamase superfamily II)
VLDRKTGLLFSGDTKFAGNICGRTDIGGSEEGMEKSLAMIDKIPYKLLCPGHGQLEPKLSSFRADARKHGETEEKA